MPASACWWLRGLCLFVVYIHTYICIYMLVCVACRRCSPHVPVSSSLLLQPCMSALTQQSHWLEHQCRCTEHLLKRITKKRSAIDALQAKGSSITSVKLMALKQELAQEHRTRAGRCRGRPL